MSRKTNIVWFVCAAAAEEDSDSEDEAQQEAVKRVDALDPEIKAKYGHIRR